MGTESELEILQEKIIPQNLKDSETIKKLIDLYFINLREQQEISEDPIKLLDTNFLIEKQQEISADVKDSKFLDIKTELFKIHLDEIYKIFESVVDSDEIYSKYKEVYNKLNINTDDLKIDFNLDNEINENYITASKTFKTKKGTKAGFFFVNDIVNKVNLDLLNSDNFFGIVEGTETNPNEPYSYTIRASLYKEVFKETILPLSHPVGFEWHFLRLLYLSLSDNFGLEERQNITFLTITCYNILDESDINRQILVTNSENIDTGEKVITYGDFGKVKNFTISEDSEKRERVVIDFYAVNPYPLDNITQDGIRIVRDYNGRLIIYTRQDEILFHNQTTNEDEIINLEIEEVKLANPSQGKLKVFKKIKKIKGIDVQVVDSVRFEEFSIFNLDKIELKYSFVGGTALIDSEVLTDENRKWIYSTIILKNKVISEDIRFFSPVDFSRETLIEGSGDNFDGRIIEDRGLNCNLQYDIDYTYNVLTTDISEYVNNIRKNNPENSLDNEENTIEVSDTKYIGDNWSRLSIDYGLIYIGEGGEGVEGSIYDAQIGEPLEGDTEAPSIGGQNNIILGDAPNTAYIGDFYIGGLYVVNEIDRGINLHLGPDADINSQIGELDFRGIPLKVGNELNPLVWRNEASFAPSSHKDLDTLNKASLVDGKKLFEVTNTTEIYERENIHNSDYSAHEDVTTDLIINMMHQEILHEPIFGPTDDFIDANGESQGPKTGNILIGGLIIETGEVANIGDFSIGGYNDHNMSNGVCANPNSSVQIQETVVEADPVDFLLKTYDCYSSETSYSGDIDNTGKKGTIDGNGNEENYKNNEDGESIFANDDLSVGVWKNDGSGNYTLLDDDNRTALG